MKHKPKLAVVMPILNCWEHTERLLDTFPFDICDYFLLYDNGSTDGTPQKLKEKKLNPKVKVILNAVNLGVARTWNCGIRHAFEDLGCENALVINNDIVISSTSILHLLKCISSSNYGMVTAYDVSKEVADWRECLKNDLHYNSAVIKSPDFSCFMITKNAYCNIGGFQEQLYPAYFEDNDYHWRARMHKIPLRKLLCATYFHFGSRTLKENPDFKPKLDEGYLRNRELYIKMWGGLPGDEKYRRICNR